MPDGSRRGRREARDRVLQVRVVPDSPETLLTLEVATVREVAGDRPGQVRELFVDFHGTKDIKVDLSFMLSAPGLARPFAEAFAHWGSSSPRTASILAFRSSLNAGFFRFVREDHRLDLRLSTLTPKVLLEYQEWLGQLVKKDGTPMASSSLRLYRTSLRSIVNALMEIPGYRLEIGQHLTMPANPWSESSLPPNSTEPMTLQAEQALFKACWSVVEATMARVRHGWEALERAADHPPHLPALTYRDFGFCLLELRRLFPHLVPDDRGLIRHAVTLRNGLRKHRYYLQALECLQPSQDNLVPFILLIAMQTGYNRDVLLNMKLSDIIEEDVLGEQRLLLRPYKGRSHTVQSQSFLVRAEPHEPGSLIPFLIEWTRPMRPVATATNSELLFLYASRIDRQPTGFMQRPDGQLWGMALTKFIREHQLVPFSLRVLRATRAENVRLITNDNPEAVRVALGQKTPATGHRHYRSQAARDRGDERFAQLVNLHGRWVNTRGTVDPSVVTPAQQDWGAATPGFTCLDPYSSPIPGEQTGRLCHAYGACPTCPLAMVDLMSPDALGRLLQFRVTVAEAQRDLPPELWLTIWNPILKKLDDYWLPAFDDTEVVKAAERLSIPALPRLSAME